MTRVYWSGVDSASAAINIYCYHVSEDEHNRIRPRAGGGIDEVLEKAKRMGVEVEIIDVRSLSPLDMGPINQSVKKTGKVMLVQEAPKHVGFMAEVSARIAEGEALYSLTEPVRRLCGMDVPPIRLIDVADIGNLPEGMEMAMPGDNVQMDIELIYPIKFVYSFFLFLRMYW